MGFLFSQVALSRPGQELWDVLVEGDQIKAVAPQLSQDGHQVISGNGNLLVPGFVDLHCHLREPGFEAKETIASGTRAAAKGGFCTVCAMPNTNPVPDTSEKLYALAQRVRESGVVRVKLIAAATSGRGGQQATDAALLKSAGAVALSDDGSAVSDHRVLAKVLAECAEAGLPYFSHCEDTRLATGGVFHDTLPTCVESLPLHGELTLVAQTGATYHLCHASSAESVNQIRQVKTSGLNVTCEVTPHHLLIPTEEVPVWSGQYKVNPPLRPQAEVQALLDALKDGVVDCIATDHAPHTTAEKALPPGEAPFGFSGLEIAFAALFTDLVRTGRLNLEQLLAALCIGPHQVLREPAPALGLKPGDRADLVLLDLVHEKVVAAQNLVSLGKNTPFIGRRLIGWPRLTMVGGIIAWSDEEREV